MMSRWRMTGRLAAISIAVMMITIPAAAAVVTQNFMRADVANNAACFTKTAGTDAATPLFGFVGTNTITPNGAGVDLIQETLQLNGYEGDRIVLTDAVHFNNNCGAPIDVTLRVEADAAGNGPVTGLGGFHVEVALWDPVAGDWGSPIVVHDGAVTTAVSGTVTIPDAGFVPARVIIDTDDAGGTGGTLYWTAEAAH